MTTVWVLGDQLNREIGALGAAEPRSDQVLMIESQATLNRPFHRQRQHFVLASMRKFARELEEAGWAVDYRRAATFVDGVAAHRTANPHSGIVVTEPNSRAMRALIDRLEVGAVRSDQFLTHPDEFADWAGDRSSLRLEDFYRQQRKRLGYLMDGDEPAEGRWNFDADNREPPPKTERPWPAPPRSALDDIDEQVIAEISDAVPGSEPTGWWATSREAALGRLEHFVGSVLPMFGPHEDAMLSDNWHLAHSMLSPYLNNGLLLPGEVCDAVEDAYRDGRVAIASAEGFIRQIIGWREFIWGIYWLRPEQVGQNVLGNEQPLPPSFVGTARTDMACVRGVLDDLDERGWIHHIPRLMVLANIANLVGVDPAAVHDWMRERYVDATNWVMGPNVFGMGMWADGGGMSTKPYVSGGAYINRMSNYCGDCRFNPKKRVGNDACPFTTLYWDFLDRHRNVLGDNHRVARQYGTLDRLKDLEELKDRAQDVIEGFIAGDL